MNTQSVDAAPSSDIFSSTFLLGNVGAPFVIGLAVGYFAKKMVRTVLFLGGAAIVLLFVAEYYDVINITDAELQHAANTATEAAKHSGGFLVDRLASITSKGASGAAGFFVGFKLG
ncbi:MAG: FUN14 domain-containing protein [Methylobacter sp.]